MATNALTGPVAARPPHRLNPFVLPPSTTSRFALLIALILAAAATSYDILIGNGTWNVRVQECAAAARAASPGAPILDSFVDCLHVAGQVRAVIATGGAVTVAVVILIGWRAHPHLLIRRQGLVEFDPVAHPRSAAEIARLVTDSGAARPAICVDPFRTAVGGRAFGCHPHHSIKVTLGTLRAAERGEPEPLRAILRHELAHVRNRDVDITSMAVVGWWALLAITLPVVVYGAVVDPGPVVQYSGRLAAVLVAVLLVRAAVLRVREHYADVQASIGVADVERRFPRSAFPEPPDSGTYGRLGSRWRRLGRMHPSVQDRAAVVAAPDLLLRAGFWEAAATGLTAGIALTDVVTVLVSFTSDVRLSRLLGAFLIGGLTATVIATSLWRETLRALALRTPLPSGTAPALGLVGGIVAGALVSPRQTDSVLAAALSAAPVEAGGAVVLLFLLCLGYCRWIAGAAAVWLSRTRSSLRLSARGGQVMAALLAGAGIGAWFILVENIPNVGLFGGIFAILALAPVLLPVVLAAVYPVAAGLLRPGLDAAHRLHLDDAEPVRMPGARSRIALVTGSAVAVTAVAVVTDAILPDGLIGTTEFDTDEAVGGTPPGAVVLLAGLLLLLVVIVLVSVIAGGPEGAGTGTAHALTAAALSADFVVLAVLGTRLAADCLTSGCDAGLVVPVLGSVMTGAVAAVLLVATIAVLATGAVRGLFRLVRRDRPARRVVPASTGPGRRRLFPGPVRIGLGVLIALTVVVPVASSWSYLSGGQDIGLPDNVPVDVRDAPPPDVAGSVRVRMVCAALEGESAASRDGRLRQQVEIARLAAAADDSAVRAFGDAMLGALRAGRTNEALQGIDALGEYCSLLRSG